MGNNHGEVDQEITQLASDVIPIRIEDLLIKVGALTMENDFLRKELMRRDAAEQEEK